MYASAKAFIRANSFNTPKQLHQRFHGYSRHKCTCQDTFHLSAHSTAKTDDTLVVHAGKFFRIVKIKNSSLTLSPLKTSILDTSDVVRLPWNLVGVSRTEEVDSDEDVDSSQCVEVDRADITQKAVMAGDIISSWEPQWVIT